MICVVIERITAAQTQGPICRFTAGKTVIPRSVSFILVDDAPVASGAGYEAENAGLSLTTYRDGYIIRVTRQHSIVYKNKTYVNIEGNFNYDDIQIIQSFGNRVEIRNENGVLITDNGRPWLDGTYPPDAKNRAGLAGLHAAPSVINPELETALMGDETNKERVQE